MAPASQLPPKPTVNSSITHALFTWQELKESIAHAISNRCFSPNYLRRIHANVVSFGFGRNLYVATVLIAKYFHFGDAKTARRVFDAQIDRPTKTILWNSLIRGYLSSGMPRSAVDVYHEMVVPPARCEPDRHTFHLVITACADLLEFKLGSSVGDLARIRGLGSDLLVATALVNMYAKCGDLEMARSLFDGMSCRDVVSWNAMISGYSQSGLIGEAVGLFKSLRFEHGIWPTESTLVGLISGCGNLSSLKYGRIIHAYVNKIGFEGSVFVSNSLMEMYIECDHLYVAANLFNGMASKDKVSWSILIGGYARYKLSYDAIKLFHKMISSMEILPTRPILLNVFLACADLGDWKQGKRLAERYLLLHKDGFESDASLITALLYMYAKCGMVEISLKLLDENLHVAKDVIAWNAMMKGCAELGKVDMVLELTVEMQRRSIDPDQITFLALMSFISSIPLPRKGIETHGQIIKRGLVSETTIANSLVNMYAKLGSIETSRGVFNCVQEKDVVSWSSMINAYALNGNASEALNLFQQMGETETRPNHFTFLAVLSACSHGGFVRRGREIFECMKEKYGLEPGFEHFTCMVDALCRAGLLDDAYHFLYKEMPDAFNGKALWGTVLSACKLHGNLVIGEAVARQLYFLDPENAANYLMLADIYVSAGKRDDANAVLRLLREKGLARTPGCSWTEGA